MSDESPTPIRRTLITTIKAAVAITCISVLAAGWLSGGALDRTQLSRLSSQASNPAVDPVTTGSIGRNASATKLDPCSAAPERRR